MVVSTVSNPTSVPINRVREPPVASTCTIEVTVAFPVLSAFVIPVPTLSWDTEISLIWKTDPNPEYPSART